MTSESRDAGRLETPRTSPLALPQAAAGAPASWRRRLRELLECRPLQAVIIGLIVANAVTLGLETSPGVMAAAGPVLLAIDQAILAVFVVEIALRMVAWGWRFFRDPWSVFDFVVVAIALLPATHALSVLRALRILRVLRLISAIPRMRRVVSALLSAIPGMSSILALMCLLLYVAAVMATKLFGSAFPEWFGTIGASLYSLFQIMTLESWSMGIVRPVLEVYPYAWLFFVPYILVTTFVMLNLFIAVIVNAMQAEHEAEAVASPPPPGAPAEAQPGGAPAETRPGSDAATVADELQALRREVRMLRLAMNGSFREDPGRTPVNLD